MRRYLPFFIVVVVGLATLASGVMLYRAKRLPSLTMSKDDEASTKGNAGPIHVRGRPDAAVTLEEFGDFQCPPCGTLAEPIERLEHDYHSRLRVVFHHFPLPNHQHAREAALAAEAAGLQGHFWEMHDLLYREQPVWSTANNARELFNSYAGILGLNLDQFKKDMDSEKVKGRVDSDKTHGASLGVTSTPTVFINNQAVRPESLNPAALRAAIDAAIKKKS